MAAQSEEKPSTNQGMSIDIFTVLGHDLKSPLNAVESYLEIMRNRVLGDTLDSYMPVVENSIARLHQMRELITDVVDWARIQQPSSSRPLTTLNVSKTARAVVDGYAKEAQARNINVSTDIENGISMKAVAREIELIFQHLISNAIKYNKENGSVYLTLKKTDSHIDVKVTDTGIGLSAEEQASLFGEFVRIKNSKTQDIRGTGLGLAIVKKLVELYQGTVSLRSEPDNGSTFSLILNPGA
ncbi:MAG: HAMP domain-containing histidine kinase [Deltaproteobacteria bacterium]|nr:HAMP domain-containing histidine kinase [Deltaproteobacteria bacterium]